MSKDEEKTRLMSDRTVAKPRAGAGSQDALSEGVPPVNIEATVVQSRKGSGRGAQSSSAQEGQAPAITRLGETPAETQVISDEESPVGDLQQLSRKPSNPTQFAKPLNLTVDVSVEETVPISPDQFTENTDQKYRDAVRVSSLADLVPGAIIKNRFKLETRLGRGGMGTIFLATDLRKEELKDKDAYIAIKFLNEELHDRMEAIISLQREAKKSQTLSHPNIVTVYDFDRENTVFFLSMEYLKGESFDQYIARSANRMEKNAQLMRYVEFMARGLAYAHQEGFVHADFKPANVFLTEQGQVKVLDFGIAQAVRSNLSSKGEGNHAESIFDPSSLGAMTPNYASLEMLQGKKPVPSDDVYGLAVVAYELLSGFHPFQVEGQRLTAKLAYERGLTVKPLKGLSRRHMRALEKGLEFKRQDRFNDAGEFIDAIKPKVKLRQSVIGVIAASLLAALISLWAAVNKTEAVIGFDDLPVFMSEIVETVKSGDQNFDLGDIDQAHKLYVQAWEAGVDKSKADSRDLFKLKVIIDRRINKITGHLIDRIDDESIDRYTLMQLELTLGFLKADSLGSMDEDIDKAVARIQEALKSKS